MPATQSGARRDPSLYTQAAQEKAEAGAINLRIPLTSVCRIVPRTHTAVKRRAACEPTHFPPLTTVRGQPLLDFFERFHLEESVANFLVLLHLNDNKAPVEFLGGRSKA